MSNCEDCVDCTCINEEIGRYEAEVSVLGTPYRVLHRNALEDPLLTELDGYVDTSLKVIVVEDGERPERERDQGDLHRVRQAIVRHELVHAFLFESGLASESWAASEELVDWIALQFPKLLKAFKELDVIE